MPFEVSANSLRNPGWATSPSLSNLPQEEPGHPKVQVLAQSQQQYSIKRATDWRNAYATSPSYTLYTRDNREAMKSLRIWRNTHVAKANLHKIWAYQRSKGFSGFLNVTKRFFFFVIFQARTFFVFTVFFFLVWSHKPTEKGLEMLIFQGGNGRRTSFFFFFKEVQLIIYFTHWN